MHFSFSRKERLNNLVYMSSRKLDLLVIGGGITGAGIALDSAKRGLQVGLIEMQDFAEGTSSRSTKLIHGGLRYLKQGEIRLVKEIGREREILFRNIPHLIEPEWMLLPIVEGGTYGRFATSVGLRLYDYLAGVKPHERRKMLNKHETLLKEPLLRAEQLLGAGYYVEYRTDDSRLTIEVLKTAAEYGANAVNYVKAVELIYENNQVAGVVVQDMRSNQTYRLRAKRVVNAAGPWVDAIREIDKSKTGKRLHLTKGVHLVVSRKRAPITQATYFDTPDQRMIFAIPREDKIYIGTTDSNYDGSLLTPKVTLADTEYLLKSINHMFPAFNLEPGDIESSWAGIRPLIHEDGKSPSELSRKDEILVSPTNLISIAGGKLTGFRKMAEKIVNLVCSQLTQENGQVYPSCSTDQIKLTGSRYDASLSFQECSKAWLAYGESLGFLHHTAKSNVSRFGSNAPRIFDLALEKKQDALGLGMDPLLYAELLYSIQNEMVVTADDFLVRRTGIAYFDIQSYRQNLQAVSAFLATI